MLNNRHVEPFVLIEEFNLKCEADKKLCARDSCRKPFSYLRITKKYCSSNCRKRNNEFCQNSEQSISKRRRNEEYFDRVRWAFHDLIRRPPMERSNWLQHYIDNPTTSKILGNPKLLNDSDNNIAKIANRFTQQVYRTPIKIYLENITSSDRQPDLYDYSVFEEPLNNWVLFGKIISVRL